MANNPLVKRVIDVLDKNKDGSISFLEFVQGLNSLSAGSTQEEKLRFAFQIYDINNDGYISNGELFTVIKMMVGNNLKIVYNFSFLIVTHLNSKLSDLEAQVHVAIDAGRVCARART